MSQNNNNNCKVSDQFTDRQYDTAIQRIIDSIKEVNLELRVAATSLSVHASNMVEHNPAFINQLERECKRWGGSKKIVFKDSGNPVAAIINLSQKVSSAINTLPANITKNLNPRYLHAFALTYVSNVAIQNLMISQASTQNY